ncbi:hypothetical protein OH76DRAFT_719071 [Lentinus brumalis]|uniref:Uncharacterized protein n=1 Tax=Lentinus brumalis TaxID=2498619 RepID=A0A371D5K6_9APHY|nr:hypothetical protein OH76DRAFT_719071 [Polyporus brumalis]
MVYDSEHVRLHYQPPEPRNGVRIVSRTKRHDLRVTAPVRPPPDSRLYILHRIPRLCTPCKFPSPPLPSPVLSSNFEASQSSLTLTCTRPRPLGAHEDDDIHTGLGASDTHAPTPEAQSCLPFLRRRAKAYAAAARRSRLKAEVGLGRCLPPRRADDRRRERRLCQRDGQRVQAKRSRLLPLLRWRPAGYDNPRHIVVDAESTSSASLSKDPLPPIAAAV